MDVGNATLSMQREWDSVLLANWQRNHQSLKHVIGWFRFSTGLSHDEFMALKRVPMPNQWYMPVRAFVASALPALSDRLWDGDQTREQMLDWLASHRVLTQLKKRTIWNELRADDRDQKRTRRVDLNAGHRRSDWGVCKA